MSVTSRHCSVLLRKDVVVGQELTLEIQELSRRGDGIARVNGKVIFVPGAKPRDIVKLQITRVMPNHAEAVVIAPQPI